MLAELDALHMIRYWEFCQGWHPDFTIQEALCADVAPTQKGEGPQTHPEKMRDSILTSFLQKKTQPNTKKVEKTKGIKTEEKVEEPTNRHPCEVPNKRLRKKTSSALSML